MDRASGPAITAPPCVVPWALQRLVRGAGKDMKPQRGADWRPGSANDSYCKEVMANDSYRWWNGYRKGVDGK